MPRLNIFDMKLDQRSFKYVAFVRLNASGETIYMPPK